MRIDLEKVAELMNRRCNARLRVDEYKGKFMIDKDGTWEIVDESEIK